MSIDFYAILRHREGFFAKVGGEVFTEVENTARTVDTVSRWEGWRGDTLDDGRQINAAYAATVSLDPAGRGD